MFTRMVSTLTLVFFLVCQTVCYAAAPLTYAPAVKVAAPAVVNVYILRHLSQDDPNLEYQSENNQLRILKDRMILGSGVIMDQRGYVLTNSHVIRDRNKLLVALADGRSAHAQVVGVDTETDLAVLKIDLKAVPTIPMANSDTLQVGDVVLAIGNPFGLGRTVTQGIISALGRTAVGLSNIENFIQTDVALNPGSSGGALINTEGQLVGINTGIYTHSGGYQGISFAIPVNAAQNILQQIIKQGHVQRGSLGLDVVDIDPALTHDLNPNQIVGVVVRRILLNSPAENQLHVNDVIVEIDGHNIRDAHYFNSLIEQGVPGANVNLVYYRANQKHQVTLRLGMRKQESNEWQEKAVKGKKYQFPDDRI